MIETEQSGQPTAPIVRPAIGYGSFGEGVPPSVNDDEPHGYSVNSMWHKGTLPQRLWICTDNTEGAAVWQEIPLTDFRTFRALFDYYSPSITTTGTAAETLHSGTVLSWTLFQDGDEVRLTYRGVYAATNNDKTLRLFINADDVFDTGAISKNSGGWRLDVHLTRSASDELSVNAVYVDSSTNVVAQQIIGSMDFGTPFEAILEAETPTSAGDVTLDSVKAIFVPAVNTLSGHYLASETWELLDSETGDDLISE